MIFLKSSNSRITRSPTPIILVVIVLVSYSLESAFCFSQNHGLHNRMPTTTTRLPLQFRLRSKQRAEQDAVTAVTANNKDAPFSWLQRDNNRTILGIQPSPEILAIMTIYFVQGALGLARLAQTYLLKDELHLGPAELSALTGLFTLPWYVHTW
jgi:hypothetical protein